MKVTAKNPYQLIVTLEEVKSHLRVKATSEDVLITTYLTAATDWANGFCHRIFGLNEYEVLSSSLTYHLPHYPVGEIISVSYKKDTEEVYTPITDYEVSILNGGFYQCIVLDNELTDVSDDSEAFKVVYTSGYTNETIPSNVKVAIFMKVESMYNNRQEDNKRFLTTAENLLMPHKIFSV